MGANRPKNPVSRGLLFLISLYKKCISPLLGPRCRFYPSCSDYSAECLRKYGLVQATAKSFIRICKCHPFHRGGVDLP